MKRILWMLVLTSCSSQGAGTTGGGACHALGGPCTSNAQCCADLFCFAETCVSPGTQGASTGGTTGSAGASGPASVSSSSGRTGSSTGGPAGTSNSSTGGPTGDNSSSSSGATSSSGGPCGGASEPCCTGSVCNGSLTCQGGSCAQPPTPSLGQPCTRNSDCQSGICLPVGQPANGQPAGEAMWTGNVCTATCTSAADCVSGWTCAPIAGQSGEVCQCTSSPEVCDGEDNDCDGIVDNEPAVDEACQEQNPADVCQGGECTCAAQNQCGGACVDVQTSASDCGSCGSPCPSGASCVTGNCHCPVGEMACGSTCSDTQTDVNNCGQCDNPCLSGQECETGACCGPLGVSCSGGQPCCTGTCGSASVCCLADGVSCQNSSDCCGGACTDGACGLPYLASCTIGSAACAPGLSCWGSECFLAQGSMCPPPGNSTETGCAQISPDMDLGSASVPLQGGGCPSGTTQNTDGQGNLIQSCTNPDSDCTASGLCCGNPQQPCSSGFDCCGFFNDASIDNQECEAGKCCISTMQLAGECQSDADCCSGSCGQNGYCT